jgi:hypothetical protein
VNENRRRFLKLPLILFTDKKERRDVMEISILKSFLLWCSIINGGMLLLSSLMLVCAGGLVYTIHSKLFGISRDAFNIMIYCFIGVYKMLWLTLNVVPYVALVIAG